VFQSTQHEGSIMKIRHRMLATTLLLAASLPAPAADNSGTQRQPPPQGQSGRPPRQPPREAFAACQGQKEGTAVTVTTPHGDKIAATCVSRENQLFARPNQPPPGPPPGGQQGQSPSGGQDRPPPSE